MPIIGGVKYACQKCINGHRTSSCRHFDRDLIEVKRKGRPQTQCGSCREARRAGLVHPKCACRETVDPVTTGGAATDREATKKRHHKQQGRRPSRQPCPFRSTEVDGNNQEGVSVPNNEPLLPPVSAHGRDGGSTGLPPDCDATSILYEGSTSLGLSLLSEGPLPLLDPLRVEALLNPCDCSSGNPCICCRTDPAVTGAQERHPKCRCPPDACDSGLWIRECGDTCPPGGTPACAAIDAVRHAQAKLDTLGFFAESFGSSFDDLATEFSPVPLAVNIQSPQSVAAAPWKFPTRCANSLPSPVDICEVSSEAVDLPFRENGSSFGRQTPGYSVAQKHNNRDIRGSPIPENSMDVLTAVYASVGTCGGGGSCCGRGSCRCQAGRCSCGAANPSCAPASPAADRVDGSEHYGTVLGAVHAS